MKEHPILFSGEMVRAILAGGKTQTRRVIKLQAVRDVLKIKCPYGRVGDHLWVRETWRVGSSDRNTIWYKDGTFIILDDTAENLSGKFIGDKWKPSIHMYRWASRITLEVTGVRVERVQNISEEDAISDGIIYPSLDQLSHDDLPDIAPTDIFKELWDSINAKRGYGWDSNPWVWVIEFKRIES